jgi:hypothetical protein
MELKQTETMKTKKKKQKNPNRFVLYMHTRKTDGGIFYIGIGDKNRPNQKSGRNNHWTNTVKKHGRIVTILVEGMTWERACELEKMMIAFYGRSDLKLGPLVNETDGGEGAYGRQMSDKTRETLRKKNKELWEDPKYREKRSLELRRTNDEFVSQLKGIYGDKYDYSLVKYMGQNTKVTIICPKHNEFEQWCGHLTQGVGCQKCSSEEQSKKQLKPLEKFVSEAKAVHGDRYDYTQTKYDGAKKMVEIKCHEHGFFKNYPGNHIKGAGCSECAKISVSESQKKIKRGDRSSSKVVLDINTGVFYDCALDVAELYGYNSSTFCGWMRGSRTNKTSFRYV